MKRKSILKMLAIVAAMSLAVTACNVATDTSSSEESIETSAEASEEIEASDSSEANSRPGGPGSDSDDFGAPEDSDSSSSSASSASSASSTPSRTVTDTEITSTNDSEHAIEVDGESVAYSNVTVTKTGDSDAGDEADFYGDNAAIFATNGAYLTLTDMTITTNGTHANAVFCYGEGTTINISDSTIKTSGNCSGGLMTTGGGTMIASNLDIETSGNSSAAIRSDRGGGTVTVTGGTYTTSGTGSPVIYSTADITVSDAELESTASQGVVVEGQNSVTLNNVTLIADNNTKNSDKSDYYQAVMIYQSMSGDADEGLASFTMTDGSLTNANGDIFFVNNTVATITLDSVTIVNEDEDGVLLRAEAAGWGTDGSNGGQVNFYLIDETVTGDIVVDDISAVNLYLTDSSDYEGAINEDNEGEVYVEIEDGSTWTLTADSYVTSLTCSADSIDLNGHKLYVNGVAYSEGTEVTGEALDIAVATTSSSGEGGTPPDGEMPDGEMPGTPPDGEMPSGEMPGTPPDGEMPEGDPPARPGE